MDDDFVLVMSPLCRTVTDKGHTMRIEIYRGEGSDWSLEVINPTNTSIVWDDQFATDTAALDEVMRTIREDGIESLLDQP